MAAHVRPAASPPARRVLVAGALVVALFSASATVLAALDPGRGSLDATARTVLGILAAALLIGAGLLRWARWRVAGDARSLVTGAAMLFLGGFGMPLTALARVLDADTPDSLLGAMTALTTGLLTLVLVVRALNTPAGDTTLRPVPLLAASAGTATVLFLALLALREWAAPLMTSTTIRPGLLQGSLLGLAWFCVGLEATLRSPHLRWAGRAAPLLGAMAVAELCGAVGAVHPGQGFRVAGFALVAMLAAVALYGALVDLDGLVVRRPEPTGRDASVAEPAEPGPVVPGRRAGDRVLTVVESPSAAPVPVTSLEHLLIRRQPERARDIDLEPLLREVAEHETPDLDVTFTGCAVRVHGRAEDLATVFRNLLLNAHEHAGTAVEVSTHRVADRVEVHVADRGPGMSLTQVATLFQRSARGPHSRGAGLGLHVAHALVQQQGGDLTLRTHAGGCTFAVTLWAAGGPTPSPVPYQRRSRRPWTPALSPAPGE